MKTWKQSLQMLNSFETNYVIFQNKKKIKRAIVIVKNILLLKLGRLKQARNVTLKVKQTTTAKMLNQKSKNITE